MPETCHSSEVYKQLPFNSLTPICPQHNIILQAKNFVPGQDSKSTKVAAAVIELQQRLPRARVLYCSATGVSEVSGDTLRA